MFFSRETQLHVSVSRGCEQMLCLNSQSTTAPVHRNHHPLMQILLCSLHEHSQPASRHMALLNSTHELKTQEGEHPVNSFARQRVKVDRYSPSQKDLSKQSSQRDSRVTAADTSPRADTTQALHQYGLRATEHQQLGATNSTQLGVWS